MVLYTKVYSTIILYGGFVMKNEEKALNEQRERLIQVFDYLRLIGVNQSTICEKLSKNKPNYDESQLSHIKSGKIKYIPDDLLERLHDIYNINPLYVGLESDFMLDTEWEKFKSFVNFVDTWDTVKKGDKNYLHLTMDQSFYDFLISVDKANLIKDNFKNFEKILENIKGKHQEDKGTSEYVVIPKNEFIQIVQSAVDDRKQFSEIIDILEYSDYINED